MIHSPVCMDFRESVDSALASIHLDTFEQIVRRVWAWFILSARGWSQARWHMQIYVNSAQPGATCCGPPCVITSGGALASRLATDTCWRRPGFKDIHLVSWPYPRNRHPLFLWPSHSWCSTRSVRRSITTVERFLSLTPAAGLPVLFVLHLLSLSEYLLAWTFDENNMLFSENENGWFGNGEYDSLSEWPQTMHDFKQHIFITQHPGVSSTRMKTKACEWSHLSISETAPDARSGLTIYFWYSNHQHFSGETHFHLNVIWRMPQKN